MSDDLYLKDGSALIDPRVSTPNAEIGHSDVPSDLGSPSRREAPSVATCGDVRSDRETKGSMGIGKAAFAVMVGVLVVRLLAMVREQALAHYFGGGAATDAFTAAGRVSDTIYNLLVNGAVSGAMIPLFSEHLDRDEESGWRLFSAVLSVLALILCVVALVMVVLSGQVITAIAGEYDTSTQELAAQLLRLMMPALVLMGMSGVLSAFLLARRRYFFATCSGAVYSATIILGAVLFARRMGISSLVIGMVLGALVMVLLQAWGLGRGRRRMLLRPRLYHEALPRLMRLYAPVVAGLLIQALQVAIDTRLASQTGEGNLAAMRFATHLIQLPQGLVAAAIGFAILPTLSSYAAASILSRRGTPGEGEAPGRQGDAERMFALTLSRGIKLAMLGILPATIGLFVLRTDVIALLFQQGAFVQEDTLRTSTAVLFFSLGIPAAALDQLLVYAFYARKNTITPAIVSLACVGLYLVVALSLLDRLGMPALALANSVQWIAHVAVLFVLLRRSIGRVGDASVVTAIGKMGAAALAMAVVMVPLVAMDSYWGSGKLGLIVRVGGIGMVGIAVYLCVLWLLRTEEIHDVLHLARARFASLRG